MTGHVATASIDVSASAEKVWAALTDPAQIEQYMFGTKVQTDWKPGSRITWSGDYEGKPYEDRGEIVEVQPGKRLVHTHYSPLSGQDDVASSYHTLTYELSPAEGGTTLSLSQDNNASQDEAERATATWQSMLESFKKTVESA